MGQPKVPYNHLNILKSDKKKKNGPRHSHYYPTYRGKSTSKTFILYRIQYILCIKILFYNFNAHSTGSNNCNTLLVKKLTMFLPSKFLSSSKRRLPDKIFCLTLPKEAQLFAEMCFSYREIINETVEKLLSTKDLITFWFKKNFQIWHNKDLLSSSYRLWVFF